MNRFKSILAVLLVTVSAAAGAEMRGGVECTEGATLYRAGHTEDAFRVFFHCAIHGDAQAQYNVAMMLRSGETNEASQAPEAVKANHYAARPFLESAAASGYPQAVYTLAQEYDVGSPAFTRDGRAATELFGQAAAAGHVDAQVDYGTQFFLGRGGVAQDFSTAALWYEKAAKAGHWGAQFLLAAMYEHGYGVSTDEDKALYWYQQAQAGGDEVAPIKVQELSARQVARTRALRFM